MTRPLRINVADGAYHVMSRGIDRKRIFIDDKDRLHFLDILAGAQERFRLRIYAYVLMGNHFHLIVSTPDANLSRAVQWIKVSYSMWFNAKHQRVGPLFQGRFKSQLVDSEESWLIDLSLYVHLNPVRVKSIGLDKRRKILEAGGWIRPSPEEEERRLEILRTYRWSSYPYYAGYRRNVPDWLDITTILERLDGRGDKENYIIMAESKIAQGHESSFVDQLENRLAIGRADFLDQVKRRFLSVDRDQAGHRELRIRYSWVDIISGVEQVCGKRWEALHKRGEWGRYLAYWAAQKYAGMTLKEIAAACRHTDYGAVNMGIRRLNERSRHENTIRQGISELEEMFNVQT